MRNLALHTLTEQLAADRVIRADEALQLRRAVFPDGVVTREEAEVLIALEARVANSDAAWSGAFVEAIVDHLLASGVYQGHVDEAAVGWLMARFGKDGARETEVETILKTLERSESAPDGLSVFTRERVALLIAGKPVGAAETELVRRCLYAASGSGATAVTEPEARWLFALDAESEGRANDAAWGDLFVKALLNHLMGRRAPRALERANLLARQAWLEAKPQGIPGASVLTMFDGGVRGFLAKIGQAGMRELLEQGYEAANAEAESDARLTLAEIAWVVGMTKEDRKRTANEEKLLAEIRAIEKAAATPQPS